jgi:hypothetical protein
MENDCFLRTLKFEMKGIFEHVLKTSIYFQIFFMPSPHDRIRSFVYHTCKGHV